MQQSTEAQGRALPHGALPLGQRFLRFALVGVVGTAVHYALLIALVEITGLPAVAATSAGFLAGLVVNYVLNRRFTFVTRHAHLPAFLRFATVALGGMVLNGMLLAAGTQLLGLHYLLSQVLATGVVLLWNFAANALWTFGDRHVE